MDRRTAYLHIDPHLCQSCERCSASKTCRLKAIVQIDGGEQPYLDVDRCRDCRVCIPACPYGAIRKIQPE
jgi:Fe-S-cluster-containing hydrogenase component 2